MHLFETNNKEKKIYNDNSPYIKKFKIYIKIKKLTIAHLWRNKFKHGYPTTSEGFFHFTATPTDQLFCVFA